MAGFQTREQRTGSSKKEEHSGFKKLLEEEKKKQSREVFCVATGYTKHAMRADFLYDKREYF